LEQFNTLRDKRDVDGLILSDVYK